MKKLKEAIYISVIVILSLSLLTSLACFYGFYRNDDFHDFYEPHMMAAASATNRYEARSEMQFCVMYIERNNIETAFYTSKKDKADIKEWHEINDKILKNLEELCNKGNFDFTTDDSAEIRKIFKDIGWYVHYENSYDFMGYWVPNHIAYKLHKDWILK